MEQKYFVVIRKVAVNVWAWKSIIRNTIITV